MKFDSNVTAYSTKLENKTIVCTDSAEKMPAKIITLPDDVTPLPVELIEQCLDIEVNNLASVKLLRCMVEHADNSGLVNMSQQSISQQTGISLTTVSRLISRFQNNDPPILVKLGDCLYRINEQLLSVQELKQAHCIMYRHASDAPLPENTEIMIKITDAGIHN